MTTEGRQDPTEGSRAPEEARPTNLPQPALAGLLLSPQAAASRPPPSSSRAATRPVARHSPAARSLAAALSATEPRSHRQAPAASRHRPGCSYAAESPGPSKREPRPSPAPARGMPGWLRGMPGRPSGTPRPRRVPGPRLPGWTGTTTAPLGWGGPGARTADACAPSLRL